MGSFAYIGASSFSGGGNSEARFASQELVEVDRDGNGSVGQAFRLEGLTAANLLTQNDFLWLS